MEIWLETAGAGKKIKAVVLNTQQGIEMNTLLRCANQTELNRQQLRLQDIEGKQNPHDPDRYYAALALLLHTCVRASIPKSIIEAIVYT